jgi:hypothetical protein
MAHDQARIREFARSYTDAWCSHDPTRVADHYVKGGTIAINGGEPTEVTEVARSFIEAFPDIQVFMDDVVFNETQIAHVVKGHSRTLAQSSALSPRRAGIGMWREP